MPRKGLQTTEGKSIRIISCGGEGEKENIFYNAKIAIDDREWCGDVIIHHRSSDWEKEERHSSDTNTNIILHVTAENNCEKLRRHGETITQQCLRVPDDLEQTMTDWRAFLGVTNYQPSTRIQYLSDYLKDTLGTGEEG